MTLTLVTPPAEHPVSLATLKAFLRVEHDMDDALITRLGQVATETIELSLAVAMISRTYEWRLDAWPVANGATRLWLPRGPVSGVSKVEIEDGVGSWHVLPTGQYSVVGFLPAWLRLAGEKPMPAPDKGGIRISFTAGYLDAASVPPPLIQAICVYVAHLYEQRELVANGRATAVPSLVQRLIAPYRQVRV